jgi:cytidylate kinase
MNVLPTLERAEAYLNIHLSRSGRGLPAEPALPLITVSREAGAGASTLARLLSDNLNAYLQPGDPPWTVFDGNLVEAMLEANHYAVTLARFLPEDDVSEVRASVGELVGLHPSLWDLTQKTNELIRRLARLGHCILIGRGANFATASVPQAVHLRLIGSPDQRAHHVAGLYGIPLEEARARNARNDAARRRYVRNTFGREIDDPSAYDLVINTDRVPLPEAGRLVATVLRNREPSEVR